MFPSDNAWNQDVSQLPVDANSSGYISYILRSASYLHADFGSNPTYGIPYVVVPANQPMVPVTFTAYADESDPGPYPIPSNAPIQRSRPPCAGAPPGGMQALRDLCQQLQRVDRVAGRERRGLRSAQQRAAHAGLDVGGCRGAADPARGSSVMMRCWPARSSMRSGSRSRSCNALTSCRPRTTPVTSPTRTRRRWLPPAVACRLQHHRFLRPGARRAGGAAPLWHDRGRQRHELVHFGDGSALGRR